MTDSYDAFERWVNGMSDDEYEDMLDESNPKGFTDAQQEKALNIRQAPTKEELEDMEAEQEFREEQEREPRTRIETIQAEKVDIRQEPIGIDLPDRSIVARELPQLPKPQPQQRVTPPKPRQLTESVKSAIQGAGRFVRRLFRV